MDDKAPGGIHYPVKRSITHIKDYEEHTILREYQKAFVISSIIKNATTVDSRRQEEVRKGKTIQYGLLLIP